MFTVVGVEGALSVSLLNVYTLSSTLHSRMLRVEAVNPRLVEEPNSLPHIWSPRKEMETYTWETPSPVIIC